MSLRGISFSKAGLLMHPVKIMEYVYVPMLISASKISDEITQAAITRWRSVGSTSLLILAIWCVCFVGRGFSVENPSLLTRLPLMEKLQESIARMEGMC